MAIDPSILELEVAGHTDPGKVRDNNEDQFLIAHLVTSLRIQQTSLPKDAMKPYIPPSGILIVVSDGMGGHEGGEVASALAVQTVRDAVESVLRYRARPRAGQTSLEEAFLEAFEQAQQVVRARAEAETVRANMGATLTAAYVEEGRLLIAHAGDSRAYRLRDGKLRQLTTDHTLAEALRSAGAITDTQAIRHHGRHILTNALGTSQEIDVETRMMDLEPDDRILIMTDGCSGPLNKARIVELAQDGTPEEVCLRLCHAAIEAGGTDNVTVVCLRAFLPPPVAPLNPVSIPQQAAPPASDPAAPPPAGQPPADQPTAGGPAAPPPVAPPPPMPPSAPPPQSGA